MIKTLKRWLKRSPKELENFPSICSNLNGTNPNGPNCWNATKLILKATDNVEFVSELSMKSWLRTNTKKTGEYHRPKAGTILVFWNGRELVHTAVYISDKLLWHKVGYLGKYEVATRERVEQTYMSSSTRTEYRKQKKSK